MVSRKKWGRLWTSESRSDTIIFLNNVELVSCKGTMKMSVLFYTQSYLRKTKRKITRRTKARRQRQKKFLTKRGTKLLKRA